MSISCLVFSMPLSPPCMTQVTILHILHNFFSLFFREKVERTNIQSQIVQESEPTRNQSFTELISELRAARVGVCHNWTSNAQI